MFKRIAKCGCSCLSCPTYKDNIRTSEDRKKCSDGWEKHLNIRLSPEKLRACDGCSMQDSDRKIYYLNCIVRRCAMINDIENCAFCTGFPCTELSEVHSLQKINSRHEFVRKAGIYISENDYRLFVEPYTGLYHLKEIRKTLSDEVLKNYIKFSTSNNFAPFYDFVDKEGSLRIIYDLLTTICAGKNISYARQQILKKKREKLLKLLWTMVSYGVPDENDDFLELDSRTFLNQKISSMYGAMQEYFNSLKEYDIYCEIVPFINKGWLTPRGGLREGGWIIRLNFGKTLKGGDTLHALRSYVLKLKGEYGDRAYRVFNRADLGIMLN